MTLRPTEPRKFSVAQGVQLRLDIWLGEHLGLSRSQIKRLVDQELVLVNGKKVKAGYKVQLGDEILVSQLEAETPSLGAEPIPLDIIYEDQELVVINKQKNLVVHPGAGNLGGTLVNALLYHVDELSEGEDETRPGIVHRLDKDTSGLMVIAKTDRAHLFLKEQLQERSVVREYLALVQGVVRQETGIIDQPIGRHPKDRKKMAIVLSGRDAQTSYQVQERFCKHSLVLCRLVTGRTHQIRVHMTSIHHPLVGDSLYGFKQNNLGATSQVLHACYLSFRHLNGEHLEFQSTPPADFLEIVQKARKTN